MLLAILRKDLLRRWRSPVATIVMLIFPFLMTGMIGSISSGGGEEFPVIRVFLLDRDDGGLIGGVLNGAAGEPQFAERIELVEVGEEGFDRMEKGEASGMLIIPENFTEDLLDGRDVQLEFLRNPAESISPEILEQGVQVLATYLDIGVKVLGDELQEFRDLADSDDMPQVAVIASLSGRVYQRAVKAQEFLFPPAVQMKSVKETTEEEGRAGTVFGYVFVMVSVMSLLFVASRSILDFFEEQSTGMLHRQLSTPVHPRSLVIGKVCFSLALSLIVMGFLLITGGLLGWFAWPVNLAMVALHTVALSLAASGLMVVIYVATRSEKQSGIVAWIVIMVMSVIGGSMFPAENLPDFVRPISRMTLNYHGVEGYLDLLVRGREAASVLPYTLVLLAFGVLTIAVGQALVVRRLQESIR